MQILSTMITGGVFADEMIKLFTSEIFIVFLVIALGYLLGRINIKGISLGSSGVFIVALVAGIFIEKYGKELGFDWLYAKDGGKYGLTAIRALRDIGLGMFVAGIGFIAGPTFIRNFKSKAVSYLGIGASITAIATLFCIMIIALDKSMEAYQGAGLLMGALSTTPGLASAQNVFSNNSSEVAALSGITYPFGVMGVVLFVQFLPKILRVDMAKEIEKLKAVGNKNGKTAATAGDNTNAKADITADNTNVKTTATAGDNTKTKTPQPIQADSLPLTQKKLIKFDSLGLCIFSMAVALGMIIGALTIPLGGGLKFSLGTTGGALLVGLLFSHFGKIGRISLEVPKTTLATMRELGLILFLTGSGIEGGFKFLEQFQWHYLLYGAFLTVVPMTIGFFIARYVFKLDLLNNLGSICGGMTSTPALGALIHVSGTEDVAQSYAATYPITLLLLVFVPQILYFIFV